MEVVLNRLGLANNACFNFHGRGQCNIRLCTNDHTPQAIPAATAMAMVATLTPELTSLRNLPPPPGYAGRGGRGRGRGRGRA
jgi:hypothetical protein